MFKTCLRIIRNNRLNLNNLRYECPKRHLQLYSCNFFPRQSSKNPSPAVAGKYVILEDSTSDIIENTTEEIIEERYPLPPDEFDGINLKRGKTGVFEIEDLVNLLQRENAKNIFVATVPKSYNYVQHICVVSTRSRRHMIALTEFVRRVFKKKRHQSDHIPIIEGKESSDWMAIDLGNIALHVFSEKARDVYDIETLWAVGPEYDDKLNNKDDQITNILENYATFLQDFKPIE